jgi:hypothetical protein
VADAADLFVDGSPVEETQTYRWHCGPSYEALEIARERRHRGDRTFNPDAVSDWSDESTGYSRVLDSSASLANQYRPNRRVESFSGSRTCARDAPDALVRGGVVSGQGRVQAGARAAERDSARGVVQLICVAKPRPEKKDESAGLTKVLPAQLRIGDRLVDESGEWQVLARPYTTAGGKTVSVRVQRADNPSVMAIRVWGAHERVSVTRAAAEPDEPR